MRIAVDRSDLIPQHVFESVSVRYHLKNGFVIYEKTSGKGYDSYSFIYPLKCFGFMRTKPLNKMIYIILPYIRKIIKILR